ncbi:MAG: hypothetical protein WA208_01220 [Thermoanaerobaculia bacterium]
MNPNTRRLLALLLFLGVVLHPAAHGESFGSWSGPVVRDSSGITDCPCLRAAVIVSDSPADPGRPLEWSPLESEVEEPAAYAELRNAPSRGPPAA